MAAAEVCLFGPCNAKDELQTFKCVAVQKIITTSKSKHDELHKTISESWILAHKSCYCSYTSTSRQRKRKSSPVPVPSKRLLKSHSSNFNFKQDCLFCGKECKPKDPKNPDRWEKTSQCTTVDRDGITFKQQLENLCAERQDQWANEVAARVSGVIDLHAACQHLPVRAESCPYSPDR